MAEKTPFTTTVGRIVQGNLYVGSDKDQKGNPLLVKNGPNIGKPFTRYFFALAIPKVPGQHWAHSVWGQIIWSIGHAAFPQRAGTPSFAWKIVDGDSTDLNENNRRPCDYRGFAGNWVIKFTSSYAPSIFRKNPAGAIVPELTPDAVGPGDYVEVFGDVASNGDAQKSGVHLNPRMICLIAKGEPIYTGADPNSVGFGQSQLPPGAQLLAGAAGLPPAPGVPGAPAAPGYAPPPGVPAAPGAPAAYSAPPVPGAVANVPPPVAQVPVQPNPGFLNPPGAPAAPVPPAAAVPQPPRRQMTAAAQGATYEACIAAGWTDATLISGGLMLP